MTKTQSQNLDLHAADISRTAEMLKKYFSDPSAVPDAAAAMVADHGSNAVALAQGYMAVLYGADFKLVERACIGKIHMHDETRVRALLHTAARDLMGYTGSTRCRLIDLITHCGEIECEAVADGYTTPPIILGKELTRRFSKLIVDDDDESWIVPRTMMDAERRIAQSINSLVQRKGVKITNMDELEDITGTHYDDSQRAAIMQSSAAGISIITGGPGTGKTTVLKAVITAHEQAGRPIVLMAPTNIAADRMREATGHRAGSIHSTLGIIPCQQIITRKTLPEDALVVVDEVSMLDTLIGDAVFESVCESTGSTLLLVGDDAQLQSIGPGAILRDIMESGSVPVSKLDTCHRQKGGALVENIRKIKDGDSYLENDGKTFAHIQTDNLEGSDEILMDLVTTAYATIYRNTADINPLDIRIFTPLKNTKYMSAVRNINNRLHEMLHSGERAIKCNGVDMSVGEPVLLTGNYPSMEVWNGSMGVIERLDPLTVNFGGRSIEITDDMRQDLELGYATTIHKSQGGQVRCAIVCLPDSVEAMLTRSLLYVAVSRPTDRCIVFSQGNALTDAISDYGARERFTGLQERIKKELKRRVA